MKIAATILLLSLLCACGPDVRTGVVLSLRGEPTAGEDLYMANCATCHGVDAEGTETGPLLAGLVRGDEPIVEKMLAGSLFMPSFRELDDQSIADVLTWLRTLGLDAPPLDE